MNPRKLRVENLEERTLLAVMAGGVEQAVTLPAPTESTTWWVATAEDTFEGDVLSLRDALARAQSGDTVRFVPELSGGTITMSEMSLTIPYFAVQKGVTVDASDLPGGITIDANGISRVFYVYGGTDSEPTVLKGLTITGGSIANDGGGIYVAPGTVTLEDCTVTGNHLSGPRSLGAGICNRGTLTVTNCIVSGNTTEGYGGGIFNSGTLTVTDTVISGNRNCGIYQNQGTATVTDSIIAGNSADTGGGIYHSSGTLTLANCTVSGNSAARYGGGIFTLFLSPSDISIRNSVIAGNTAANDGNEIYKNSLSAVICACNTLSSYTDWTESENCLEYDPNLPLFTDAENGDYTLAAGSQAINAGNNDFVTTETDLAENPRIMGGIVDLGAYEYQAEAPSTVVTTHKDVIDETDGLISLREAVLYAAEGDTITFASELCGEIIVLAGSEIVIDKGITIDASSIAGIHIDAGGKSRVFYVSGGNESAPVELINLTITSGNPNNESSGYYPSSGGGIYNAGTLAITNSTISSNSAQDLGGGVYNEGTLTLTRGVVEGNDSGSAGGGLYNDGTLTITESTIAGNTAYICGGVVNNYGTLTIADSAISDNSSEYGGGITNTYGTLTISNSIISGNYTENYGGGIGNYGGSLVITDSTISENYALYYGGGIYGESGTLTICDSTVTGNDADIGAGIYCAFSSELTLTNSTVSGNTAYDYGGGIYNDGKLTTTNCTVSGNTASGSDSSSGGGVYNSGTLTMTNCAVSVNTADYGGGIFSDGMLTLTNCTVSGNTASLGGGIYDEGYSPICNTILENTIIALNTADTFGDDIYVASATIYAYNTLSSTTDWSLSSNCLLYDPEKPLFVNAANSDYTLAENSQAIDKGNNDYVTTETDLAGNKRIANGIVDIGAYEYGSSPPVEQLASPTILTGNKGVYVSYGANRHQITWDAIENASGYELTYTSDNRDGWTSVIAFETSAVITGLTYGDEVAYRVRALGTGSCTDSEWSEGKTFAVCPMDINGDGDIGGLDRNILAVSWGGEEGEDEYWYYADINADGDIGGLDRNYLGTNWGAEAGDDDLAYPKPLAAADIVFAEYQPADLEMDLGIF